VDVESLADALIANTSGQDSIGQIYRFLRRHQDPRIAREEFVRFLRGEKPELLLRTSPQLLRMAKDKSIYLGKDSNGRLASNLFVGAANRTIASIVSTTPRWHSSQKRRVKARFGRRMPRVTGRMA
jgi:hypothetical protein